MSNEKKTHQLGEPFGTASHKLRKSILFHLLLQLEQNTCFRCGKDILNLTDLSIEHKKPWLDSDNPKFNFYDLNNIAFSHLSCNCAEANKNYLTDDYKSNINHKGVLNPNSKLTESDVIEIRKLIEEKIPYRTIAKKFNVAPFQIWSIKTGKTWSCIPTSLV